MAAGASDATTPIVPPAPAPVAVAPPAPNPVTREADAEAQFHVMAGEMAAGRNQPGIAASEFIAALQRVDDADLAKRATALAIAANDEHLALQAAQRWLQVEPNSMDAREVTATHALSPRALATTPAPGGARVAS